jgi:hypothetical protein
MLLNNDPRQHTSLIRPRRPRNPRPHSSSHRRLSNDTLNAYQCLDLGTSRPSLCKNSKHALPLSLPINRPISFSSIATSSLIPLTWLAMYRQLLPVTPGRARSISCGSRLNAAGAALSSVSSALAPIAAAREGSGSGWLSFKSVIIATDSCGEELQIMRRRGKLSANRARRPCK